MIRVRLHFGPAFGLDPDKVWCLLKVDGLQISDVISQIADKFNLKSELSHQISLVIDDSVVPKEEQAEILREGDLIQLKVRGSSGASAARTRTPTSTPKPNNQQQRLCSALTTRLDTDSPSNRFIASGAKRRKLSRETDSSSSNSSSSSSSGSESSGSSSDSDSDSPSGSSSSSDKSSSSVKHSKSQSQPPPPPAAPNPTNATSTTTNKATPTVVSPQKPPSTPNPPSSRQTTRVATPAAAESDVEQREMAFIQAGHVEFDEDGNAIEASEHPAEPSIDVLPAWMRQRAPHRNINYKKLERRRSTRREKREENRNRRKPLSGSVAVSEDAMDAVEEDSGLDFDYLPPIQASELQSGDSIVVKMLELDPISWSPTVSNWMPAVVVSLDSNAHTLRILVEKKTDATKDLMAYSEDLDETAQMRLQFMQELNAAASQSTQQQQLDLNFGELYEIRLVGRPAAAPVS